MTAFQQGYIHPSTSPAALSFFSFAKNDGGLRPCIDYWSLHHHKTDKPSHIPTATPTSLPHSFHVPCLLSEASPFSSVIFLHKAWSSWQPVKWAGATDYPPSRTQTGIAAAYLHLWFNGTWTFHPTLHLSRSPNETLSQWKYSLTAYTTQLLVPNHQLSRTRQWTHANRHILAISGRAPMTADPVTVCTVVWCIRLPHPLVSYATSTNVIFSPFNYLVLENSTANLILGHPHPSLSCYLLVHQRRPEVELTIIPWLFPK